MISNTQIEHSTIGVFLRTQASATFAADNVINGHSTAGVLAQRNTSIQFNPGDHVISNNGFGVNCTADTVYAAPVPITFVDNN